MGYDQLNPAILRGTSERMRYIGCTRKTRKTDAHRTLKYVLIILACLAVYPESPQPLFLSVSLFPSLSFVAKVHWLLLLLRFCGQSEPHATIPYVNTRQKNTKGGCESSRSLCVVPSSREILRLSLFLPFSF